MARLFDDGASQCLKRTSQTILGWDFTVSLWFRVDADALVQMLFTQGDVVGNSNYTYLAARTDSVGDPLRASFATAAVAKNGVTTNSISVNTWHHAFASYTSSAVTAILDGDIGNKGTQAHVLGYPIGMDNTLIGAIETLAGQRQYTSGRIAEVCVWGVGLPDAAAVPLSKGYSPLLVRPESIIPYWQLIRDTDEDIVSGYSMTPINGPTVAAHPPVVYPGRVQLGMGIAAPPIVRIPRHPAHYNPYYVV